MTEAQGSGQLGNPTPGIKHPLSKKNIVLFVFSFLGKQGEGRERVGVGWSRLWLHCPELLKDVSSGEAGWGFGVSAKACPSLYLGWDKGFRGGTGCSGKAAKYSHTARQILRKQVRAHECCEG